MERSEPSLVPEWLRSTGGGSLSHHFASSQADGPSVTLPKRNRNLKSSTSDAPNSSFLYRSSSTNSRRSTSVCGSSKHDKNSYLRSYSCSTKNQHNKDREKLDVVADSLDSEYSDPLSSIFGGRIEKDSLRHSKSTLSKRPIEFSQCRVFTDLRNRSHNINGNGNGSAYYGSGFTGIQNISFESDFPLLGSDEKPSTPDIVRVSSPGLSRGVQGLSIGTSSLIGCEGWTSALAEVPVGVGTNSIVSSPSLQPPPYATGGPPASVSISSAAGASNSLNMAEALVQAPARSHHVPEQLLLAHRLEDLPSVGSKRLIPLTPSMPKTSVLNPSDKLKPKTAARFHDGVAAPKNGLQQLTSVQLGNQAVHGGIARADGTKASSGKVLLLKPGREKSVSHALNDVPNQKTATVVANGLSTSVSSATGVSSVISVPLKNPNNMKHSKNDSKTYPYSLNGVQLVDKRLSLAQLQSRNDFFNLVRKKSMGSESAAADSGEVVSSGEQNSYAVKETACGVSPTENGNEVKCIGDTCNLTENLFHQKNSNLSHHEYSDEEELDFLRTLGWEDEAGDDEGLTEEEINAFVQKYMKRRPALKLPQALQLKIITESNPQGSSSPITDASSELRTADSSL